MTGLQPDWRLRSGIASLTNTCVLFAVLSCFPLIIQLSQGFGVAKTPTGTPAHTRAFITSCLFLAGFLWTCFIIAIIGIRRRGTSSARELINLRWNRWQAVVRDLGIAAGTLLVMLVIGATSNALLGPLQPDNPVLRAMTTPQNRLEALGFLVSAISAGIVEEFVFRGYIQRQFQALFGNTVLAALLQVLVFTAGHIYQGGFRLIPVFLIGSLLTAVALWRKGLVPGMIAHGLGDGMVTFFYLAQHF